MSLSTDHRLVATLVSRCEDLAATVKALQHENDALRAPAVSGSVDVDLDLDAQVQAAEAQLLELKQLQNEKRLQREKEGARTKKAGVMPHGTEGGLYDPVFMKLVEPLYDMHMGCENMGPMLYNLVRFLKPKRILEVGAGYTSIFILQALKDNIDELVNYQRLQAEDKCYCGDVEWCVEEYLSQYHFGQLTAIDNLEHPDTTAHLVVELAEKLGARRIEPELPSAMSSLTDLLENHDGDAWVYPQRMEDEGEWYPEDGGCLDMLWVDFGAGEKLDEFLQMYWPLVKEDGGLVLVHSTMTNALTHAWKTRMERISLEQQMKAYNDIESRSKAGVDTSTSTSTSTKNAEAGAAPASSTLKPGESWPENQHELNQSFQQQQQAQKVAEETGFDWGPFRIYSFREPHKMYQNSFTLIQRRGEGYNEPILTMFP